MKKRVRINRNRMRTIVCSLMAFLVLFYAIAGNAVGFTGIKADTTEEVTAEAENPPESEEGGDYISFKSAEEIEAEARASLARYGLSYGGPGVTHPAVTTMGTWENGPRNPLPNEPEEGRIDREVLRAAVFDLPTTQTDTLTNEGRINYNNHFTDHFKFGGTETFCLEPSKASPAANTSYKATRLGNNDYDNWLRSIFYFGYGGPGYYHADFGLDHHLEADNKENAYAITHIIVSYAYDYRNWHNAGEQGELQTDAFKGITGEGAAQAIQAYKTIANYMWDAKGLVPENFEAYLFNEGTTTQPMGYGWSRPVGWLYLNKKSANENVTNGNSNYDLGGASYYIYDADSNWFRYCFLTDSNGKGWRAEYRAGQKPVWVSQGSDCPDWITLEPGHYWVQEYDAAKGYQRDETFYEVDITAGQSTYVGGDNGVKDEPIVDPYQISIEKTGDGSATSLAGAEFTLYYFDELRDGNGNHIITQDNVGSLDLNTATRKWVIKTIYDNSPGVGKYIAKLDTEHWVSGDAFYTNSGSTTAVVPVGTMVVTETKAPAGYQIQGNVFKGEDGSSQTGNLYVTHIEEDGSGDASVTVGNNMTIEEKKLSGDVEIVKKDKETGDVQGSATLAHAEYSIVYDGYAANGDADITVDGQTYSKGQTVKTIETDENGYARTYNCTLPEGSYYIYESKSPAGYRLDSATHFNFTINTQGQLVSFTDSGLGAHGEEVKRGGVRIYKIDKGTNSTTPQGKGTLGGAVYKIVNVSAKAVRVNGVTYAPGSEVIRVTIDGNTLAGATAADVLPYGNYYAQEVNAPTGYKLDSNQYPFTIREDNVIQEIGVSGNRLTSAEEVIRGGFKIQKWDYETQLNTPQGTGSFAGIKVTVTNLNDNPVIVNGQSYNKDAVVATFTTDNTGYLETAADLLPYGDYQLTETFIPDANGYRLSGTITQLLEIRQDGVIVDKSSAFGRGFADKVIRGGVKIQKWDYETQEKTPQGGANFEGITFEIVSKNENVVMVNGTIYQKDEVVATMTTDASGLAQINGDVLPKGNYTAREKTVPGTTGYLKDGILERNFSISRDGEIVDLSSSFHQGISDKVIRGGFKFQKYDYESHLSTPEGGGSFEGITVTVTNNNTKKVVVNGHAYGNGEVVATFTTDENGYFETSTDLLPYGDYIVKETNVPSNSGYLLNGVTEKALHIRQNGVLVDMSSQYEYALSDKVVRGDFMLRKIDADTQQAMADVEFKITLLNRAGEEIESHIIKTDANGIYDSSSSYRSHSDPEGLWFGNAAPDDNRGALVFGTYKIEEIEGPANMGRPMFSDTFTVIKTASSDKMGYKLDLGNVENVEIAISTLAECENTGSQYAIATEDLSIVDTVYFDHLSKTSNYKLVAKLVDTATGEFLKDAQGNEITGEKEFRTTTATGSRRVELFIPDATILTGKTIVIYEYLYDGDRLAATHEDITDVDQMIYFPGIGTTAQDAENGTHTVCADDDVTINDTVSYWNVQPNRKYRLTGVLMDKETGEAVLDADGNEITAVTEFVPTAKDGEKTVTFQFDGTGLEGKSLVVFETLTRVTTFTEVDIATHKDINDEGQTISFPKIRTTAVETTTDETKEAYADTVTIKDTITYKNLTPGQEYTASGTLMDKETGEEITVLVEQENGTITEEPVTAETTFTPENADGSVEVEFTFDASALKGKTVVAFETLKTNGYDVAVHMDIEDEKQSVHFPEIGTTAYDSETGVSVAMADNAVTIYDTVSYKNLIPGNEYKLQGVLMNEEDGTPLTIDGEDVTAEITFTALEASGTVEVAFTFDASELAGKSVVAFEKLFIASKLIASHEDITDEEQTVHFPDVHTSIKDGSSEIQITEAKKNATVVDTVAYTNVKPGMEYEIKGILMDKATGEPVLVDGKEVTCVKKFTPSAPNGKENMTFTFDASALKGYTLVAFESLYVNSVRVAAHCDIEDIAQTEYFPNIHTTAVDSTTKGHVAPAGGVVTIIDTVMYENLIVGKEYEVTGVLMDKATGKELLVDGKKVESKKTFTAEQTDGSVEVAFTFDASALSGTTVVAFETVSYNGVAVATHANIKDKEQTVHIPDIHTTAVDSDTKTHLALADDKVTIIDTVTYKNLIAGEEYEITGVLMDKATGKELLVDGKKVEVKQTFKPENPDGTVDMKFTFNASALGGTSTVVYETIAYKGVAVASHKDINDKDQTVRIPDIKTTALDESTKTHLAPAGGKVTIIDTVTYKNLYAGKEYEITGVLMDKATGKELLVDGKKVEVKQTFMPEKPDGTVDMKLSFDSAALSGKTIVVFETITYKGSEVANHKDITDIEQTVYIPDIHTTALDESTKTHLAPAGGKVTIVDTVKYQNLIAGEKYEVTGVLMDKATGKELLVNGKTVEVKQTFKPEKTDGTVDMKFTFDASALDGATIVVFETIIYKGVSVASHKDITDIEQTVYVPSIHTNAIDNTDGDKTLKEEDGVVTIKDTITYKNLLPGVEYKVYGTLMNKSTKAEVMNGDKAVTGETVFTPQTADGTVDVTFTVDVSEMGGQTLVVFEKMYLADSLVASHEDINDEAQAVVVNEKPPVPQTGDIWSRIIGAMVLSIIFGGTLWYGTFGSNKKRRRVGMRLF